MSRRWPFTRRFSLRLLLMGTTVVAIFLAILVNDIRSRVRAREVLTGWSTRMQFQDERPLGAYPRLRVAISPYVDKQYPGCERNV